VIRQRGILMWQQHVVVNKDKEPTTRDWLKFGLAGLLVVGLVILFLIFKVEKEMPLTIEPPLTWHAITPGKTSQSAVIRILGAPDKVNRVEGYESIIYQSRADLAWEQVQVVFDLDADAHVLGILLTSNGTAGEKAYSFSQILKQFGAPAMVLWGDKPYVRFLGWPNRGLGLSVMVTPKTGDTAKTYADVKNYRVFIFQPESLEELKKMDWLCCRFDGIQLWSDNNKFLQGRSNTPDVYLQDPFDWNSLIKAAPDAQ